METRFTALLNQASRFCLYLAVFLVPLFWLPITADALQFNKYFLLYGLTLISLFCFLVRAVKLRTLEIRRTILDWPLVVLWASALVVSLTSEQKYLSFFGDFSNLGVSFISLTIFLVWYWLLVQHLASKDQVMRTIYLLLVSGALSSLYFVVRALKLIDLPWNWLPALNTAHNSNGLFGLFIIAIFVLALGLLAIKTRSLALDSFSLAVLVLSGIVLVLIGFKTLWIILAIALVVMLIFFLAYLDEIRSLWSSAAFVLLVATLLLVFLGTPKFLTAAIPVEISLSPSLSWSVAVDSITNNLKQFLLGSGLGTFGYRLSAFRPAAMNGTFAWNVRFSQPWNSALEWLTTSGVVATLALLAVMLLLLGQVAASWVKHILDAKKRRRLGEVDPDGGNFYDSPLLFWGLVASWITVTASFFMSNWGAVQWTLWWLLTALVVVSSAFLSNLSLPTSVISLRTTPQYTLLTSFGFIIIFTGIIVAGIYLGRFYAAEVVYARSLGQPLAGKIAKIQRAIELNPNRTLFHLALSDSFLGQATQIVNAKGDINQVYQSVALSVAAAKRGTEVEPNNAASWEFLSTIYANARAVAPEANDWLIKSLDQGIRLEPTNPTFYLGRGNAYLAAKRFTEAGKDFEQALSLKPDWPIPAVQLALSKEAQGDLDGAIYALERGLIGGQQEAVYLFQLGRYHFNRNKKDKDDLAQAEFFLQRALALNQNYADALYALGTLYQTAGRKDLALPLFQRVAELNPNNKEIQRRLNSLNPGTAPSDDTKPAEKK